MLSVEEKKRFLKALEEDLEFRYAVMGLLGFKEILDRITRLEERQQRLEERQQKLEERFAKLEERIIKLEERQQKLEEKFTQLEERFIKLEERVAKVEERLEQLSRTVTVIAHRFGILTERGFREAMKLVAEDILGVGIVERWTYRDDEGMVYGYPATVEVDLAIHDDKHILVEVKSRASIGDVAELARIGKLYEKVKGIKTHLVLVAGFIDPKAYEAAAKLGVEIRPLLPQTEIYQVLP